MTSPISGKIGDLEMSDMLKIENLKGMIIEVREQSVLLDSDVTQLYGVETKRINEAVKNNPENFPQDYMFGISKGEFADLPRRESSRKHSPKKGCTCLLPSCEASRP